MRNAEARVALIVRGVIEQALRDAGMSSLQIDQADAARTALLARWCELPFDQQRPALMVGTESKTELLLAGIQTAADVHPLGDLYQSELMLFCPDCAPRAEVAALAVQAGGLEQLDGALRALLDERRAESAAFAGVPQLRQEILSRMQQTRFRRTRTGIIPKLGARTIGIDLFI